MSQGYYTPEGRLRKLVPSGADAPRGRVLSSEYVDYGEDEYSTPLVNPLTEGEIRSSEPEPDPDWFASKLFTAASASGST